MATIRYRVLDLPVQGVGAFTPLPSTNPVASSWGLVKLSGSPGTMPIPRPKRNSLIPISADPKTQSTNCAPDVGFPDIYIPYADNMGPSQHFGMAARRQTPIPVPAVSWINAAMNAMSGNKIGGRVAAAWPRAFQRWPTIMNSNAASTK
jgi:hypothetical protein